MSGVVVNDLSDLEESINFEMRSGKTSGAPLHFVWGQYEIKPF